MDLSKLDALLVDDLIDWDEELHVSISQASRLTKLKEHQIRYLEELPGVMIGRKNGRNREYTKRDILLLKWIYRENPKPAELAEKFALQQQEILKRLAPTLPEVIRSIGEHDGLNIVITGLVRRLLSIWQNGLDYQPSDAPTIHRVILGPANEHWRDWALEQINLSRPLNLAGCLVIDNSIAEQFPQDARIYFSNHTWFVPIYGAANDIVHLIDYSGEAFSILIQWKTDQFETTTGRNLLSSYEPSGRLARMILESLSRTLQPNPDALAPTQPFGEFVTTCSRFSADAFVGELSLNTFLATCIEPYFPGCFCYIAKWPNKDMEFRGRIDVTTVQILASVGDMDQSPTLTALDEGVTPWWLNFADRKRTGPALARDVQQSPWHKKERGSIVCIPLLGTGNNELLGALCVERMEETQDVLSALHQSVYSSQDFLQYLLLMSEVPTLGLELMKMGNRQEDRVRATFSSSAMIEWYWDIYEHGPLNYTRAANEILDWLDSLSRTSDEILHICIVDVTNDTELAEDQEAGFGMLLLGIQELKERVASIITDNDVSKDRVCLVGEPIADHIVFAIQGKRTEFVDEVILRRIQDANIRVDAASRWKIYPNAGFFALEYSRKGQQYDRAEVGKILSSRLSKLGENLIKIADLRLADHKAGNPPRLPYRYNPEDPTFNPMP